MIDDHPGAGPPRTRPDEAPDLADEAIAAGRRRRDTQPGDRCLLCPDGLTTVGPTEEVRQVITTISDPEQAVRELVDRAQLAYACRPGSAPE